MRTRLKVKFLLRPTLSNLVVAGFFALVAAGLCGCDESTGFQWGTSKSKPDAAEESARQRNRQRTAPLPRTIGSACFLEGTKAVQVQGYGLVVGLAGKGSKSCPAQVESMLRQAITKYQYRQSKIMGEKPISAGALINSPDTAVVTVFGRISSGAVKGGTFDVAVRAMPNTGTISLEGGRLFTCELRRYVPSSDHMLRSKPMATASGQVFVNPFEKKRYRRSVLLRRQGYILGGGVVVADRELALTLNQPSYSRARSIEQKINSVFSAPSHDPLWRTVKAISPSTIQLKIPPPYREKKEHFLSLIQNMYIRDDPAYINSQAGRLTEEILDPYCNAEAISYAWEAMGRVILPIIQPVYRSSNIRASFYAVRAGAMLGDSSAVTFLEQFAMDAKGSYRRKAIETLTLSGDILCRQVLRKVVRGDDLQVRVLAYEGLAKNNDAMIRREIIGEDNFILDRVLGTMRPLIYVTRRDEPKIVIFGEAQIRPPVFYSHTDDSVIISAEAGDKELSLLRRTPSGNVSGRIPGPMDIPGLLRLLGGDADIVGENVTGLGLPYSHIVAIMHKLCQGQGQAIQARFKLQELIDLQDEPDYSTGRPERD